LPASRSARRGLKRPHQPLAGVAPADLGVRMVRLARAPQWPCTDFGRFSICVEFSQFLPIRKCCNATKGQEPTPAKGGSPTRLPVQPYTLATVLVIWLLGIRQAGVGQARQRSARLLGQVDPD
jgi:hypothetical protein